MKNRNRLLAAALAAGASLAAQAADLGGGPGALVANEGTLASRWMLAPGTTLQSPAFPAEFADRGEDVCLAVGYRIGADGKTSDFAVLKQWTSAPDGRAPADDYWRAFAASSADAISQWRFAPRPDAGMAHDVYTVATVAFNGTRTDGADVRSHCRIDDLAYVLQARSSQSLRDYSLAGREMDRAQRVAERSRIARVAARAAYHSQQPPPPPPAAAAAKPQSQG